MGNILVTGANGLIGNALCRRLLTEGWNVRGTIRSKFPKAGLPSGLDIIETGNINSNTSWEIALDDIDVVVHLAAKAHVGGKSSKDHIIAYRETNVDGTKHLAQVAASKKVRRFIFLSSIKVNGEGKSEPYTEKDRPAPIGLYAVNKFEAEMSIQRVADHTGLETVILRPPLVYGPNVKENFLKLLKIIDRGIPLPLAAVENRRSMIYIRNLVDAILHCARHPEVAGKTFLIGDGQDLSTPELIQKISNRLGKPSRLFAVPVIILHSLARITGRSSTASRLLDSLTLDQTKIQHDLNWVPPFTVEEGLDDTVKWYLQTLR